LRLSQDGRQTGDSGPPEQNMAQASKSAQRPPFGAGRLLHPPNLHLYGHSHGGAHLCEPPLLPQLLPLLHLL
ncbi:hypothetical protein XENORESO_000198, partial [Xenotaenia resolanae]